MTLLATTLDKRRDNARRALALIEELERTCQAVDALRGHHAPLRASKVLELLALRLRPIAGVSPPTQTKPKRLRRIVTAMLQIVPT